MDNQSLLNVYLQVNICVSIRIRKFCSLFFGTLDAISIISHRLLNGVPDPQLDKNQIENQIEKFLGVKVDFV